MKLWIGFSPGKNGVFSAGNGPAMRAPIIGVYFADDVKQRTEFVRASTVLTHTDPKAFEAALMAAECAAFAARGETGRSAIFARMREIAQAPEWEEPLNQIQEAVAQRVSVEDFSTSMGFGKGVSGYAVHTMVMVLFIWLRHRGDFKTMMREAIGCGGDTDSVAAIVGGISGVESRDFDSNWVGRMCDYPYSIDYLHRLGKAVGKSADGQPFETPDLCHLAILPRNIIFLTVVLLHGVRRIFPPY